MDLSQKIFFLFLLEGHATQPMQSPGGAAGEGMGTMPLQHQPMQYINTALHTIGLEIVEEVSCISCLEMT